jgi:hypothetical protein
MRRSYQRRTFRSKHAPPLPIIKLPSWLIAHRPLSVVQAEEIMREQGTQTGHIKDRFGRIAVKKGYISEADLNRACLEKEREELTV